MYKLVQSTDPNTEDLPGSGGKKQATTNVRPVRNSDE
jgi:hypothetical protein